jgi:N4-(beta-N-acetylglucosaminyl)-L-asparaginase
MSLSRRRFLEVVAGSTAVAGLAGQLPGQVPAEGQPASAEKAANGSRPCVVASRNGLRGVAKAYEMMTKDKADPLDAAIAGVNIQELDPNDSSVGLGGLPNEEGVVQLDASCMHGPTRRAGAVAALEGIATPSLVAKAVMDHTDHILLVGAGAKKFALQMGFKEQELLTEASRRAWLRWKSRLNANDNWLEAPDSNRTEATTGTINMCAVDANGNIGSVTTTSGLSWKLPGRVGDSPLVGAGQYCDNRVGAAGGTGRGEANIKGCGAFYIVELMRGGMSPYDACKKALERVVEMTEDRLLGPSGRPRFDLQFYAVNKAGQFGGAAMYGSNERNVRGGAGTFAVANADGARLEPLAFLYPTSERPRS